MGNIVRKYNIGILGATGAVGQRFLSLLENHPWFHVSHLMASEKSAGKRYKDACDWILDSQLSPEFAQMKLVKAEPQRDIDFVFSGLDASVALDIEQDFAKSGIPVVSNTRTHRMISDVPLVVPEINPDHLNLIDLQKKRIKSKGYIVTNPNCSTIILSLALAQLYRHAGLSKVLVTTMQAVSGAGYPGVSSLDIIDNIIPFITGEEEKIQSEPLKIFGILSGKKIKMANINISAKCNRVNVSDGHLMSVSVKLRKKTRMKDIMDLWSSALPSYRPIFLPSECEQVIEYQKAADRPQPKKDRNTGKGMSIVIGQLQPCSVLDFKFTVLGHNTIRGASGGSILLAELLVAKNYL